MFLWCRGKDGEYDDNKAAKVVKHADTYIDKLEALREAASVARDGSKLPQLVQQALYEGSTFLAQIQSALDTLVETGTFIPTGASETQFMAIIKDLESRGAKLDELLRTEATRRISLAIVPEGENSLDEMINLIKHQNAGIVALGSGDEPKAEKKDFTDGEGPDDMMKLSKHAQDARARRLAEQDRLLREIRDPNEYVYKDYDRDRKYV
jgi:hypothetical protein